MGNTAKHWTMGLALGAVILATGCQAKEQAALQAATQVAPQVAEQVAELATAQARQEATLSRVAFAAGDARSQARQFIGYYHSIALTPEQAAIKQQALSAIPAPCCKDFSIATCCCPCNLAKSVWGLSNHLIVEGGAGVEEVRQGVLDWLGSANPRGYAGDSCDKGRCGLPFAQDGCGGMNESRIS